MWKVFRRMLLWGPLAVAALLVFGFLALPWPVRLRWHDPHTTSFMRYRLQEAQARGETLELRREWVPLEDISPEVLRAVVIAEDARFREHRGVDWQAVAEEVRWDGGSPFSWRDAEDWAALLRAARYYAENRDRIRGRSTITQQLAKNLYFTPERSLARKAGELLVTQRLEWFLTKDRILELYLNTVELGPGVFGVGAAAREYFGTSAARLTRPQAASLAATLPHPLTSNPAHRPGRMAWRRDLILTRMGSPTPDPRPVPVAPPPPDEPDVGQLSGAPGAAEPPPVIDQPPPDPPPGGPGTPPAPPPPETDTGRSVTDTTGGGSGPQGGDGDGDRDGDGS